MELIVQRRWWVFAGCLAVICVLCALPVLAQGDASIFEHRARMVRLIDSDPERFVAALEQVFAEVSSERIAWTNALMDDETTEDVLFFAKGP